jgi:hypothetical protein
MTKNFWVGFIAAGINIAIGQIIGCNNAKQAYKPIEAIVQDANKDSYQDIVLKTKTGKEFVFYGVKDGKYLSNSQLEEKLHAELENNYSVKASLGVK